MERTILLDSICGEPTLQDTIEAFALATEREWHPERYGITPSEFPTAPSEWGAAEWLYVFYAIFALYGFAAAIINKIKQRKNPNNK